MFVYRRQSTWLLGIWLAVFSAACPPPLLAGEALSLAFGVVPQQSPIRLAQLWTPVCSYLAQKTGYRFDFKTAKDIPTFEDRLAAGEYDIAYMNPYHYTVFSKAPGYRAFAKESDRYIQGLIVVKSDSPYRTVDELKGKKLAFPAPAAFAASVLPQAYLANIGIEIHPVYVNSHDSVYLTVSRGIYPAGGGIQRTFDTMPEAVRSGLRILWKTPRYTPHAFAAHPRVAADVVERTAAALISMAADETGRKLLQDIGFNPIGPASDGDWDDVRRLEIQLLSVPASGGRSGN